jgi:hypothetical protein
MSGTSMAAPHAAGAVARLLSRSPAASPEQVHEAIVSQATPGVLTDIRTGSPNLLLHADPLAGALYTTFATRPAALIGADRATFAFAANVPATYACRLDEAPWAACASPHTVTGLADGTHTLRVRATDADGATEVVPAQVTFTVDTIAPTTVISGASVREDGALAVTFAADEQADHACRIDDAPFADCTSPWLVTGLPVGDHRVEVRATDAVGNIEDPPARRVIRVEAPPVAPAPGPAPGPLTPAPPVRRPAPAEPAPAAPAPRVGPIGVSPLTLARGRMPVRALAVTFRLTAPARVRVVVHRRISGRRIAGRCVSPALAARSTARARPCVRYVRVGALSRAGAKGVNRVALRPPARGPRALSPGRYRVTVVARAAGAPPVVRHADTIIRAAGLR